MRSWHCVANMRMRKVKWATDYLPTASCLVKEPSKQAGNWKSYWIQILYISKLDVVKETIL